MAGFRIANFGEFLTERKEFFTIDDFVLYKRARVQLHWKGIILRDEINGIEIKTKQQQSARVGELLVAEIDAKVGGIGIVPPELDGAIVSSHYFLFVINEKICSREWLDWYVRSGWLEDQVNAQGSTNYAAIRPSHVLNYGIPLPPLNEQRRIVRRIEALAARVRQAQELRREAGSEHDKLLRLLLEDSSFGDIVPTPMNELVNLREPDISVLANCTYHFAGVYSFGRGAFRGPVKEGSQFSYTKLTRLHAGNFFYPKLMAWEGAYAIVPPEFDGLVVSPEFPVFELNQDKILPETIRAYFSSPTVWESLSGKSTGTNVRRRRLNPATFMDHNFPLPPMKSQLRLREVELRVNKVRLLQAETQKELDALLPSILDRAFKGEL